MGVVGLDRVRNEDICGSLRRVAVMAVMNEKEEKLEIGVGKLRSCMHKQISIVNLLCVTYQTEVLEFNLENLLVQSFNAPNRLLFKTTLKPLQGACISYLSSTHLHIRTKALESWLLTNTTTLSIDSHIGK